MTRSESGSRGNHKCLKFVFKSVRRAERGAIQCPRVRLSSRRVSGPRGAARGTFRAALGARTPRHVLRVRLKVDSRGRFSLLSRESLGSPHKHLPLMYAPGRIRCRKGSRARKQKVSETVGKKNPASRAGSSGGRYWLAAGGYADQIALEIVRDPPADERVPRGLQPTVNRSVD